MIVNISPRILLQRIVARVYYKVSLVIFLTCKGILIEAKSPDKLNFFEVINCNKKSHFLQPDQSLFKLAPIGTCIGTLHQYTTHVNNRKMPVPIPKNFARFSFAPERAIFFISSVVVIKNLDNQTFHAIAIIIIITCLAA